MTMFAAAAKIIILLLFSAAFAVPLLVVAQDPPPAECSLSYDANDKATDSPVCDCAASSSSSSSSDDTGPFTTFPNGAPDDDDILHCGNCGACSNCNDIAIYQAPELFDLPCAITYILVKYGAIASGVDEDTAKALGRSEADKCLDDAIPFTTPCRECWTDAVTCTPEVCNKFLDFNEGLPNEGFPRFEESDEFPCGAIGNLAINAVANGVELDPTSDIFVPGTGAYNAVLLPCLLCDAQLCEPTFLECSGSSRRRTNQVSPILEPVSDELEQPVCVRSNFVEICAESSDSSDRV